MSAIGAAGLKSSEFLALFFAFAIVALSGLDVTAGVIDYHLDLKAALGALVASGLYGGYRTALKHKAVPTTPPPEPAPTAEQVADALIQKATKPKETS